MSGFPYRFFIVCLLPFLFRAVARAQEGEVGWDPVMRCGTDFTAEALGTFVLGVMITVPIVLLHRRLTPAKVPRSIFR